MGQCFARHRHQEFLKFLEHLDQEFPGEVPLHLVMDNYGTDQPPKVRAWLKRHPRFVTHLVPTSSSWLNLIERWFSELSSRSVAARFRAWKISRKRLRNSWRLRMKSRNRSSRPPPWTRSWKSFPAAGKL